MDRNQFIKKIKEYSNILYSDYGLLICIGKNEFSYLRKIKGANLHEDISLEEFIFSIKNPDIKEYFLFNLDLMM